MLGWIYILFFLLQVFGLIRACVKKRSLKLLLIGNILSVLLSCFLLWYFDTLPGFGMMPGFAYFPEVFTSLCAGVAFAVLTLVTALIALIRKK